MEDLEGLFHFHFNMFYDWIIFILYLFIYYIYIYYIMYFNVVAGEVCIF